MSTNNENRQVQTQTGNEFAKVVVFICDSLVHAINKTRIMVLPLFFMVAENR